MVARFMERVSWNRYEPLYYLRSYYSTRDLILLASHRYDRFRPLNWLGSTQLQDSDVALHPQHVAVFSSILVCSEYITIARPSRG